MGDDLRGLEVQRSLGRIEGALKAIQDDIKSIVETNADHDMRLRKVEGRIRYSAGVSATVGTIAGIVAALFSPFRI